MEFLNNSLGWVIFGIFIAIPLLINILTHKTEKRISIKEEMTWTVIWISLALAFNVFLYFSYGDEKALEFLAGYLIEKSLSLDNLFVFLLIFQSLGLPDNLLHFVLFWGVLGAIVMRGVFIFLGVALISKFHFIVYIFGAFLIYTGIKFAMNKSKEIHIEKNIFIRLLRNFLSISPDYTGKKFFIRKKEGLMATPLFIVLIAIETTDLLFAIDSIPAILAITQDPFIVYTSNIFAILGLRSFYFVLESLMGKFRYFHYGMALILVVVGVKMIVASFFKIPIYYVLGIIVTIIFGFILASLFTKKPTKGEHL